MDIYKRKGCLFNVLWCYIICKKHIRELYNFTDKEDKLKYVSRTEINDLSTFDSTFIPFIKGVGNRNLVFRGMNNASFRLYSSLQRSWRWKGLDAFFKDHYSYIKYQIGNKSMMPIIMQYLGKDNVHDYNVLALIQHYGGDSNLLDFTTDIKSALFFAFDKCDMNLSANKDKLSDYVSIYAIDSSHLILQGPKEVSENGAKRLQSLVQNSGIPASKINAAKVLSDLSKSPYDKMYDGKIVHDGNVIYVPYFSYSSINPISNANLKAQKGLFFQTASDDTPFEALLKEQHHELTSPILMCYDIRKDLINDIKSKYDINYTYDQIYPNIANKRSIEKAVKTSMVIILFEYILRVFNKYSVPIN